MHFPSPSHHPLVAPATMLAGLLLSLAVGAALYLATAKAIDSDAEARFRGMARAAQHTIDARIKSYTDVLRGTAGLFHANADASAEDFRQYVEQLDTPRNFPGMSVINFAHTVGAAELPAIDADIRRRLRQHGMPEPAQRLAPVPGRDSYSIITYIEPASRQALSKLGKDLERLPHVRRIHAAARDSNSIAASGNRLSMEPGPNPYHLAMRLPVYRSGMPIDTVEQRRAAFIGTAGIGFGVAQMVGGVLDEFPVKGVRLVLRDLDAIPHAPGEAPPSATLYDSQAGTAPPAAAPASDGDGVLHASLPVRFNQREWRADFSIERSA
ncbi:CHASE domain-containing protein, partial [Massilia sp. MS-15]|uniref:CHASE domain-containing protein n=1 Tax=Massilia sp. MS-15 TaxID=2878200 RepID=UPI001CD5CE2B